MPHELASNQAMSLPMKFRVVWYKHFITYFTILDRRKLHVCMLAGSACQLTKQGDIFFWGALSDTMAHIENVPKAAGICNALLYSVSYCLLWCKQNHWIYVPLHCDPCPQSLPGLAQFCVPVEPNHVGRHIAHLMQLACACR